MTNETRTPEQAREMGLRDGRAERALSPIFFATHACETRGAAAPALGVPVDDCGIFVDHPLLQAYYLGFRDGFRGGV